MPAEYEWIPASDFATQNDSTIAGDSAPTFGSISACIVVRNEGQLIRRCLESLAGATERTLGFLEARGFWG